MKRRRQIYEGKAKILYEGPEPGTVVQYFKDDTTAFDATKKALHKEFAFLGDSGTWYFLWMVGRKVPAHEPA